VNISIQINLGPDDTAPTMTPAEMLTALGGDPEKDSCGMSISAGHSPPVLAPAPVLAPPPPPVITPVPDTAV